MLQAGLKPQTGASPRVGSGPRVGLLGILERSAYFPQHFLYFLPDPQEQGSLRPISWSLWMG